MSVRPPSIFRKAMDNPLQAALDQEVLQEKADTLSRQTRKLEQALKRLNEAAQDQAEQRLAEAGEALWCVTIQRELCGLGDHKAFYDFMGVPKKVRLHAGPIVKKDKAKKSG